MSLDPIVSLSVAIAESPGSYAFLLGSGASRDAGIPTGTEVRWGAVGDLYRVETGSAETPDPDGLQAWLDERGRSDLAYSDLLELIAPDQATRRDYLAKHFEGVPPGPTHDHLAELAARGVIRVFVTTNFDRLLENALHARGIGPIIVTSDADLAVAPVREHAECYVVKPHGDYLQQTIRNTPAELAELEPEMTGVLQEIFDRYGLVILGYSGGDEAIGAALRGRRSRYGLYWVARGDVAEPGRSIIEACAGRTIVREGAAEFLTDLGHRLRVFEAHPTGLTPLVVHDEVLQMLKDDDSVSLSEAVRREQREFEERFSALTAGRSHEQLTNDSVIACHDELLSIIERRLASLIPLLLHDRARFDDEIRATADLKERQPLIGGYGFWIELLDWCLWVITYSVGASAVRLGRMQYLAVMFETTISSPRNQRRETFAQSLPGEAGGTIGTSVMQRIEPGNRLFAPQWELLRRDLAGSELIRERYPELASEDAARAALVAFDLLLNIGLGVRQGRVAAHWAMYTEQASAFARQLAIPRARAAAAEAVGLTIEDFNARAPDALNRSHKYGHAFTGSLDAIIATVRNGATADD